MFAISQNIMIQTKNSEKTTILPYFIISYPHREVKEKDGISGEIPKQKNAIIQNITDVCSTCNLLKRMVK